MNRARILQSSSAELDALFRQATPGSLPDGEGVGTVLLCPGTWAGRCLAGWVRWLFWQGKIFQAQQRRLINRISPFGCRAIQARLRMAPSWIDRQESIVLDYSSSSRIARRIRDEIREVAPGLYLGKCWWGRKELFHFLVSFQFEPPSKVGRRVWAALAVVAMFAVVALARRLTSDVPVVQASEEDHFKYGSTGGERDAGIPVAFWQALPNLFSRYLPGPGLASLGFIYETNRPFPIGVSQRRVQGIDRVFLNCAVCHVGTVRDAPSSPPRVIVGMPAHRVDLQAFERFLFACARDENFNAERLGDEIDQHGSEDWLNRLLLRLVAVNVARQRLLTLAHRFSFMDREPDTGPGRVDTFNPPKVLMNFAMDKLPAREWVGNCDLPSIWNQGKRTGMWLHWDGNNNSVEERNRSAAFGTGALPPTLDRPSVRRMENFIRTNTPPPWPYSIDTSRSARGGVVYAEYCARCHGRNGSDFSGELVGQVTPIEQIGTDRHRLDSYSLDLCANQNLLYAGYPGERFQHFRKTFGYANQPLDGIWLRGPYLHNGSVPTLRELLEPAGGRRTNFYRGYDVVDRQRVGFVSDVPEEAGRRYFRFDTRLPGNGNFGHEGRAYGTELPASDKDALVEHLKTF
jgi:hypothetical protein